MRRSEEEDCRVRAEWWSWESSKVARSKVARTKVANSKVARSKVAEVQGR